jgi:hypothetical protein
MLHELGARKKKVEGQKHGQKGLIVTDSPSRHHLVVFNPD